MVNRPKRERVRFICALAALVCTAVIFTLLFSAYARRFDRTMTQENRARLEEVSEHVAAFMERAVEQQWEELRVAAMASSAIPQQEDRVAYLGQMAEELGFAYIGLAGTDRLLYSTNFQSAEDISQEDYFGAACAGETFMTGLRRHIFWDRAVSGVILSCPAPEETGEVVVAMLSMEKLGASIQVDSFDGNGFSYIIDAQGEQVFHAKSMAYNNLFQTLDNLPFEDGYSLSAMQADIAARRAGMTSYTDLGVEKYAYYRPLSFNDWTVVSTVPKGVVTARTSALTRELILMCAVAVLVFLSLLILVSALLLRLESRRRANRAKSDFLANMSHDMRTPMNAIMGMTDIARDHAGEPDTVRDCMRKISFSSKHLLGLINDMLDLSRIESGKMTLAQEPFSLSEVLESVENMTFPRIHAKGQHFDLRLHGVKSEFFLGDSLRLGQIFVNLLTNAMKFTPEGGRIAVDITELPSGDPDHARFRFTFTDSGIGMKPDFLKDLFTPFTRERNSRVDSTEGSGLGMSITKRIIDLMDGSIEVQSTEGQGTTFTVTLPLLLNTAAPELLPPPIWRILLVDRHQVEAEETARTLEAMGVPADCAPDLIAVAAYPGLDKYQAVFVDRSVYTPEGTALLRKAVAAGTVLFLTAYDWEDIRQEAARAGIQRFLQKPLLSGTLSQALRTAAGLDAVADAPAFVQPDLSGRHILLVEDNELNLEVARAVLAETGAAISWASDGAECVAVFEQSPVGSIDLILMDIQMPRMNGYEATAYIRGLTRPDAAVPILAMSANAYAEDVSVALASGMNGYLTKPIDTAVWIGEISKILKP